MGKIFIVSIFTMEDNLCDVENTLFSDKSAAQVRLHEEFKYYESQAGADGDVYAKDGYFFVSKQNGDLYYGEYQEKEISC